MLKEVFQTEGRVLRYRNQKTNRTTSNRRTHSYSQKFKHPSVNNCKVSRQEINKDVEDLKNTINELDLMDIYKTLNNSRIHVIFK